jgi:hypothetical protein
LRSNVRLSCRNLPASAITCSTLSSSRLAKSFSSRR